MSILVGILFAIAVVLAGFCIFIKPNDARFGWASLLVFELAVALSLGFHL
jgi:hypothetical protein